MDCFLGIFKLCIALFCFCKDIVEACCLDTSVVVDCDVLISSPIFVCVLDVLGVNCKVFIPCLSFCKFAFVYNVAFIVNLIIRIVVVDVVSV